MSPVKKSPILVTLNMKENHTVHVRQKVTEITIALVLLTTVHYRYAVRIYLPPSYSSLNLDVYVR